MPTSSSTRLSPCRVVWLGHEMFYGTRRWYYLNPTTHTYSVVVNSGLRPLVRYQDLEPAEILAMHDAYVNVRPPLIANCGFIEIGNCNRAYVVASGQDRLLYSPVAHPLPTWETIEEDDEEEEEENRHDEYEEEYEDDEYYDDPPAMWCAELNKKRG